MAQKLVNSSTIQPGSSKSTELGSHTILSVIQGASDGVKAELALQQKSLWRTFKEQRTEMILTRLGRRMFPVLDFHLTGLEADQYYSCMVKIVSADCYHYRYDHLNTTWLRTGTAVEQDMQRCTYIHPTGISMGRYWMEEGARFDKLKLSNIIKPDCDHVVLSSLQKYKAQLVVTKLGLHKCERWLFEFPETEFIAVTSYQSASVKKLKIDFNPYARAFRRGICSTKTVRQEKDDHESPEASAKRACLHLSNPPPITRPQCSFVTPPPTTACTQAITPRNMSIVVKQEHALEIARHVPAQMMTSQHLCVPPMNGSFRLEVSGSFCNQDLTNQNSSWSMPNDYACSDDLPESMYSWRPMSMSGCGLFEDLPLRHSCYDNAFWREN